MRVRVRVVHSLRACPVQWAQPLLVTTRLATIAIAYRKCVSHRTGVRCLTVPVFPHALVAIESKTTPSFHAKVWAERNLQTNSADELQATEP